MQIMQIMGYKVSKPDKDIFIEMVIDELCYDKRVESLPEEDITHLVNFQEPLSLLAQSRIILRRRLADRGNNIYRSVRYLNAPKFVEDIILMRDKEEIAACISKFGKFDYFSAIYSIQQALCKRDLGEELHELIMENEDDRVSLALEMENVHLNDSDDGTRKMVYFTMLPSDESDDEVDDI